MFIVTVFLLILFALPVQASQLKRRSYPSPCNNQGLSNGVCCQNRMVVSLERCFTPPPYKKFQLYRYDSHDGYIADNSGSYWTPDNCLSFVNITSLRYGYDLEKGEYYRDSKGIYWKDNNLFWSYFSVKQVTATSTIQTTSTQLLSASTSDSVSNGTINGGSGNPNATLNNSPINYQTPTINGSPTVVFSASLTVVFALMMLC